MAALMDNIKKPYAPSEGRSHMEVCRATGHLYHRTVADINFTYPALSEMLDVPAVEGY